MENRDRESVLARIANLFRRITNISKLYPYIFLMVYCLCLILDCIGSDVVAAFVSSIYGCTLGVCILLLMLSKTLGLCIWHKIACVIPLLSTIVSLIDSYLFAFSHEELIFINMSILVLVICYLIWSFFHFFIDGQQGNNK